MNVFSRMTAGEANEFLAMRSIKYKKTDDGYHCPECDSVIMQTTLYVSVHDRRFGGQCAGGGQVNQVNYPYCPQCEPNIAEDTLRACIHV